MLISFRDLTKFRARLDDETFHIGDLLFSADGTLKYLVVETGAWLQSRQTLVALSVVGDVDVDTGELELNATRDAFADAPQWSGDDGPLLPILTAMPPLVVGPFGATHAPLAMAAETGAQEPEADPRAAKAMARLEAGSDWTGAEVFGSDGELGRMDDLLLDLEHGKVTHLVVDNGRVLSDKLLVVPFQILRHRAEGGHVVLNVTAQKLADAPQIDQIARLERHWQDDLHAYFIPPM